MRTFQVTDILTDKELRLAESLYKASQTPAKEIAEKITGPHIERINETLGQENDPLYLAYAIEFYFMKRIGDKNDQTRA